jgi:hypothetical protein
LSLIISVKLYEDSKACQPPSLPLRYKIWNFSLHPLFTGSTKNCWFFHTKMHTNN